MSTSSHPKRRPAGLDLSGVRTVRCPGCGGASEYSAANAYRPFCSARCKNHDFGAWASEGYSVAADPDPEDPDAPPAPALPH